MVVHEEAELEPKADLYHSSFKQLYLIELSEHIQKVFTASLITSPFLFKSCQENEQMTTQKLEQLVSNLF